MTPLTNVIQRLITTNDFRRFVTAQRYKRIILLALMAGVVISAPVRAQSAFETLPPVNTMALSRSTNNFAVPSSNLPERVAAEPSIAPITLPPVVAPTAHSNAKKWWVLSGIALTAASLVDFGTSMGHNEANPALQTSTGQFSATRGLSLKLGLAGATMLFQAIITRHRPELYGPCAVVNAVGAGAFGAVAVHNTNTPR